MADALDRLPADLRRRPRHDPADGRVRLAIGLRAGEGCEYCLLPTGGQFQIDHIIPPALWPAYTAGQPPVAWPAAGRGGPDHVDNYARVEEILSGAYPPPWARVWIAGSNR